MTVQLVSDQKIAETSSKGNQEKWQDGSVFRFMAGSGPGAAVRIS